MPIAETIEGMSIGYTIGRVTARNAYVCFVQSLYDQQIGSAAIETWPRRYHESEFSFYRTKRQAYDEKVKESTSWGIFLENLGHEPTAWNKVGQTVRPGVESGKGESDVRIGCS